MPNHRATRKTTPRAEQAAETRQRLVAAAVDLFSGPQLRRRGGR